jgi:hypothetical protein
MPDPTTQHQNPADYGRVRQPYQGEATQQPAPVPEPTKPAAPVKPAKEG